MRYCKRISLFFGLVFFCFQAFAGSGSIVIRSAELSAQGDVYKLNADLEITLDEEIEEAINKGVPVAFLYEFELVRPRIFWFDDEIVMMETSISVSYHALSRQYLVTQSGRQTSHEILSEAMIELVQLYDWKVLNQSMIESDQEYEATLSVKLDQSKLPKAIQVEAIGSEDWSLVSEAFEWLPKDLNK
ncbi:MAG: hypothetical protein COB34_00230 [Methylophilaceae bacterium]|nr:MAG: hypothetical protein COB34_00230 [Methylophilaceae bacterium]